MPKRNKTRHYKPPEALKSVVIPLRVTEEQRDLFVRAAQAKKCLLSHWLRDAGERIARTELDE